MLHHESPDQKVWGLFSWWRYRTRTARHRRRRGNKHPSGVFVSARFPTHRNVYRDDCRFVVDGTGLEQQRRRPPPAAETGSRGWGRVLIFQSPAKGLRKNQQTQPVQAPAVRFRQGSQRIGMSTKKDAARLIRVGSFCFGGRHRTRTARAERSEGKGLLQNSPLAAVRDTNDFSPDAGKQRKAGYHHEGGILPFESLYG